MQLRETFLEIDLSRVEHNLNVFRKKISPQTKILANLKGNAYGTDALLLGKFLEQKNIDYFSVAYINEGVRLRKAGIQAKLLVFNPSTENIQALIDFDLEPEVSSLRYLNILIDFLRQKNIKHFPIHIKLDTGMHRAGIMKSELNELIELLNNSKEITIQSLFTHLAASEDPDEDDFTIKQLELFEKNSKKIKDKTGQDFFKHALNSAGVFRFPQYQMDMIRPGLGIFGYNLVKNPDIELKPIARLLTKINQIKYLSTGESVGYNRKFIARKPAKIALLPLGYADGISRKSGNGNWKVHINGKQAPIVGNVSMDTISIDVTGIDCKPGDEVIVFDNEKDVYRMSEKLETIPYEIITSITQRVPRIAKKLRLIFSSKNLL